MKAKEDPILKSHIQPRGKPIVKRKIFVLGSTSSFEDDPKIKQGTSTLFFTLSFITHYLFIFIPSEARPKAEPVNRVTRSGIRTTKVKKKF